MTANNTINEVMKADKVYEAHPGYFIADIQNDVFYDTQQQSHNGHDRQTEKQQIRYTTEY
jgi:hypothetical protein